MEGLPAEICLKIFQFFDHLTLATAPQVCRKWRMLASDDLLWSNLFKGRWGKDSAAFYTPQDSKTWKDVYIIQDRCDRYGLGLKIIREGREYYLIHQGEIQRSLGQSKREGHHKGVKDETDRGCSGISDNILFFLGDLEAACTSAKRTRM